MKATPAKLLTLTAVGAVIVISLALFIHFSKEDDAIHIAFAGPMSGENARAGKLMTRAIALYLDELNKSGGMNGKRVVLDIYDDRDDPDAAGKNALEIVEKDRVLAVIGHRRGACSIRAGKIYQAHEIPAATPSAIGMDVTRDNAWYFRTIYNARSAGLFLANYIKKVLGGSAASLIHEDGAYRDLARSFEKTAGEVGLAVNFTREFKAGDENLDEKLGRIVDELGRVKDAGVIVLPVQSAEGVALVKRLKDAGIPGPMVGPPSFSEKSFLQGFQNLERSRKIEGYYTNGVHVMTPLLFDTANAEAQELKRKYELRHPGESLDWPAAFAYDSAKVIIEAMVQSGVRGERGTRKDDRRKIRRALADFSRAEKAVEGASGLIYFDEDGDAKRPISIGVFKKNRIISALTQLRSIRNIYEIPDPGSALQNGRVLTIGGEKMAKTRVVYTGMNILKISDLDLHAQTFRLDGWLWFRYQGNQEVGDVEFLNAVQLEETAPVLKRSD
ncbi:MAG: ABC transporter substrate-binding protein, partial [Desulfobacterales bacterium]|nr:ABC transporter substrate-binding protein [Desulfobacterales bacterium]